MEMRLSLTMMLLCCVSEGSPVRAAESLNFKFRQVVRDHQVGVFENNVQKKGVPFRALYNAYDYVMPHNLSTLLPN